MFVPIKIRGENFASWSKLNCDFDKDENYVLLGDTGSGKSYYLIEPLKFVLFKVGRKDSTVNDAINLIKDGEENMWVEIDMQYNEKNYRIRRSISAKDMGSGKRKLKNSELSIKEMDDSFQKIKEEVTDKEVSEFLGINKEQFLFSKIITKESVSHFFNCKPTEAVNFLLKVFGWDRFPKISEEAKKDKEKSKILLSAKEEELSGYDIDSFTDIRSLKKTQKELTEKLAQKKSDKKELDSAKEELKSKEVQVSTKNDELNSNKSKLEMLERDLSSKESESSITFPEFEIKKKQLRELDLKKEELNKLKDQIFSQKDQVSQEMKKRENVIQEKKNERDNSLNSKNLTIENLKGKVSNIDEEFGLKFKVHIDKNIEDIKLGEQELRKNLNEFKDNIEKLKNSKLDIERSFLTKKNEINNKLESAQKDIVLINEKINLYNNSFKFDLNSIPKKKTENSFHKVLENLQEEVNSHKKQLETINIEIGKFEFQEKQYDEIENKLKALEGEKNCPTCTQELTSENISKILESNKEMKKSILNLKNDKIQLKLNISSNIKNCYQNTISELLYISSELNNSNLILKEEVNKIEEQLNEKIKLVNTQIKDIEQKVQNEESKLELVIKILEHKNSIEKNKEFLNQIQSLEKEVLNIKESFELEISNLSKELEDFSTKSQESIRPLEENLTKLNSELENYSQIKAIVEEFEKIQEEKKEISELQKRIKNINQDLETLNKDFYEKVKNYESLEMRLGKFSELEIEIENLVSEVSTYDYKVEALNKDKEKYTKLIEEKNKIEKEYKEYDFIQKTFSTNGLPKRLLLEVLPKLEERANFYLNYLRKGEFKIKFSLGDDKKQTLKRSIHNLKKGKIRGYDYISYGEKSCVNISFSLALIQMINQIREEGDELLFIDEGDFSTLDPNKSLVEAINILKIIKKIFKRFVLITHLVPLQEAFDNVKVVKKDEQTSYISDLTKGEVL